MSRREMAWAWVWEGEEYDMAHLVKERSNGSYLTACNETPEDVAFIAVGDMLPTVRETADNKICADCAVSDHEMAKRWMILRMKAKDAGLV